MNTPTEAQTLAIEALEGMIRLADMGLEESLREPEENGNYAAYNRAKEALAALRAPVASGEGEVERLRKVLRPFAAKAEKWEANHAHAGRDSTQVQHRLGDFRAARSALHRLNRIAEGLVEIPFAHCCAEAGGYVDACVCVNKDHGTAWSHAGDVRNPTLTNAPLPAADRPANCRNRLRDEGKPYPRSGCSHCRNGGLMGCPFERKHA